MVACSCVCVSCVSACRMCRTSQLVVAKKDVLVTRHCDKQKSHATFANSNLARGHAFKKIPGVDDPRRSSSLVLVAVRLLSTLFIVYL
jgi:hypothetical protein